jgi:hypothetical protein
MKAEKAFRIARGGVWPGSVFPFPSSHADLRNIPYVTISQ